MKKIESLNKFKKFELNSGSFTAITGGTKMCTTFRNGPTANDNFDDASRNQSGGWSSQDLTILD